MVQSLRFEAVLLVLLVLLLLGLVGPFISAVRVYIYIIVYFFVLLSFSSV